jgi:hypothetical protein
MLYSDDIDFLFQLHPHGWSTMRLHILGASYERRVTSVIGDPLYDFIQSLITLIKGEKQTSFTWYDEPGGVVWDIQQLPDAKHVLAIRIDEFFDSGKHDQGFKNLTTLTQFNITLQQFLLIGFYQMKKLADLLRDRQYASNRRD